MTLSLDDILEFMKSNDYIYEYYGSKQLKIEGFCSIKNCKRNSITWIKRFNNFDISLIDKTLNLLIVSERDISTELIDGYNVITCDYPKEVFFNILRNFFYIKEAAEISTNSVVLTKNFGKNVSIGSNCFIGEDVIIGDNVIIKHNVVIDGKAYIGSNTTIFSGVVIGSDGYGYYQDRNNNIINVPHFGGVTIGSGVDIGANTCIDKGTIDDTIIEDNVKIDNLCHIGHNVHIKKGSYIIASTVLGGSSTIEKGSYIAPGALIMNQITVGENSLVGMGAVVTKDVEANKVVVGIPAKAIRDNN